MSLSGLFNIGRSAILASQTGLTVTNNNIANVNTPGYNRQEVILEINSPVRSSGHLIGNGVSASGIRRHYDRFIETQILGQSQVQGRAAALEKSYSGIEQVFNESQNLGMTRSLSDYFNAWQELATNPQGQSERVQLLQKAQSLVRAAQSVEQGMTDTIRHINDEVANITARINETASKIASLNDQIIKAEAGGNSLSGIDFRDQRDLLLKELGQYVDIASYENQDGSLNIAVGSRNLVTGVNTSRFRTSVDQDGNYEIFLDNINVTAGITKGQLGGFISARADIADNPITDFRKLIASLVKEVNLQHQAGFGLDGSTGNNFFTSLQVSSGDFSAGADITAASITNLSQVTLDEYNITFDAANNYFVRNAETGALVTSGAYASGSPITFDGIQISIAGAVTANDRFFVSPLTDTVRNFGVAVSDYRQIAASVTAAGVPGDNGNALAAAQLAGGTVAGLGASFQDFYRTIVSYAGTAGRAATDGLAFENNLMDQLNQRRDAVSGVSLDEEAVNMIKFQRSFEAGARMISVTDELMQTILNL